jgi:PspA-Associated protein
VIVRILGEGQFEVDDAASDELNSLDATLEKAVDAGDERAFQPALAALIGRIRSAGRPVPADTIKPSDLILPRSDADLAEVREMLTDDGLIPG